jgi:hypothetical protein
MKSDGVIALCSKARQALAQAKTIEDFKDVRDVGEAAIRLAKSRRDVGIEALLEAQEIVRRAERQLGAMLPEVTGGRGGDRKSKVIVTLDVLGLNGNQSKRFQKIAQLPDEEFESWVSGCREAREEMTQAAALRLAAEFLADPIDTPAKPPHEEMASAVKNAVTKFVGQLTTHEQYMYVRRRIEQLLEFLAEMEAENGVGRSGKTTARTSAG